MRGNPCLQPHRPVALPFGKGNVDADSMAHRELHLVAVQHRHRPVFLICHGVGVAHLPSDRAPVDDRRSIRGLHDQLRLEQPVGISPTLRLFLAVHQEERDAPVVVPLAHEALDDHLRDFRIG